MDVLQNSGKYLLNFDVDVVQLVLLLTATVLLYKYITGRKRLPPGPYGLPLVGYLPFLGDDPPRKLIELGKKYGSIMSMRLGRNLVVILNDYEAMKSVYTNPNSLDRAHNFTFLQNTGFGEFNGQKWIEERRLSMHILKEMSVGTSQWENLIQEEVHHFIDKIRPHISNPFDIGKMLRNFLVKNVLSLLIGRCPEENSEEFRAATSFAEVSLSEGDTARFTTQIPFFLDLLKYLGISDFKQKHETVDRFLDFLRSEIEKRKHDTNGRYQLDFINLYMEKRNVEENTGKRFIDSKDSNLLGNMNSLFVGSVDTIHSTLMWLFRLMAKHPDVQRKVQQELDEFMAEGDKVSCEKRKNIPYTTAVILETLRYSTIAPMPASRSAVSDFEVSGYIIPKGTQITTNMKALHFDPNYWEDPHKFKPERFLKDDGRTVESSPDSFVPFSLGRRNCPGERISWIELINIYPILIQRFSISLPNGEEPSFDVIKGLVEHLKPQKLIFTERAAKNT